MLSSLQAACDLLGAALSVSSYTRHVEPDVQQETVREESQERCVGICIFMALSISLVALCICGIFKLLKFCKSGLAHKRASAAARARARTVNTQSRLPLPHVLSAASACTNSSGSSTTCSSPRGDRVPTSSTAQLQSSLQLPPLPAVCKPNSNYADTPLAQSIELQCRQQPEYQPQRLQPQSKAFPLRFWRRR